MDNLLDKDHVYAFMTNFYPPDDYWPTNSYEDRAGVRHAVVWEKSWGQSYRLIGGEWVLEEWIPF